MAYLLLLVMTLLIPLFTTGCAKYWDMAESSLVSFRTSSGVSGPATRWVPLSGQQAIADGPDFHAAFARCRWMAEQGILEPVDADYPGPRMFVPSDTNQPGQIRPIPQERIGEYGNLYLWPTEARIAPCMRAAGFAPARIPQRRF